jgi:hypothetical protein
MNSKFLSVNLYDLLKGAVVSAGTALTYIILPLLEQGTWPETSEWKSAGVVAACAFVSYILKQLFTNSEGKLFKTESGD